MISWIAIARRAGIVGVGCDGTHLENRNWEFPFSRWVLECAG